MWPASPSSRWRGCLFILVVASKRKVMADSDNTTGHVWDEDLREMNNPLPRWWVWLFIITMRVCRHLPGAVPGPGHQPRLAEVDAAPASSSRGRAKAYATMAPVYAKFAAMPAEQLAKDPQAMAIGERLFVNNCAQCHGSDARGSKGFPNLTDGDWLGAARPSASRRPSSKGRTA
jgi:cytochrome c oxidase cbb3-type subunit 3